MSGRRLTAILAADIAGYSALMAANEVDTVAALKGHQSVLLPMVASFGGRVVDVAGDGILAEFPSVLNAVKCAASMQEVMLERNTTVVPERRMRFRIGINQGDVLYDEHRIFGDGVNIAARLEGVCDPGGICISGKVYDEIKDRFDAPYEDIGEQYLKNIPSPVRAYKINLGGVSLGKQIKPPSKLALKLRLPALSRSFRLSAFKLPAFNLPSMRSPRVRWVAASIVPLLLIAGGVAWWTLSDDGADADEGKPAQQLAMNTSPPARPEPAPRPSQSPVAERLQAEAAMRPPADSPPSRPPESTPAPTPTPERTAPEPTPVIEARPTESSYALQNVRPTPQIAEKPAASPSIPAQSAREPERPSLGDTQDIMALSRRGQQLAMRGEYTFAKLHFDEILLGRPQNVEALNDRCWVNAMIGDLPGALKDCDRALELRPNYPPALDSRGLVKLKLNRLREAIADYDAALAVDGKLASSLYGRGIAKRRSGNVAGGDADIARARQIKADIANEFNAYGIR